MSFDFFGFPVTAWQTFCALGLLFVLLEVFAAGFILLPIGLAFLLTAPMTLISSYWLTQLAFFGVNLIVVFFLFNKVIKPKLKTNLLKTNVDSLSGKIAEVIEPIKHGHPGYVKLYGDQWQAYFESESEAKKGEKVKIVKLDGNKVIIEKI